MNTYRKIRKNIEVEVNETVNVEIGLTVSEITDFIWNCSDDEKKEITKALHVDDDVKIEVNTVNDLLKMELITEAFNKFSLIELEEKLK